MTKTKHFLGKVDNESIYLSAPSWDCGWYWGFGYLGNKNCHYHLDGIREGANINFKDALLQHFDTNTHIFKHDGLTWTFCELVLSAYALKKTAEVLGRGGSHMTTNPCAAIIKNVDEVKRINEIVLPAIFAEIEKTITGLQDHCKFLDSKDGMFVLCDKHHNIALEIMTYKQAQEFIQWRKDQGFNIENDNIRKIKRGENFVTSKGTNLVKLYDVKTGECSVMLENSTFASSANEKLKAEILEYRKS